jgi:hypothetical protein
MFRTANENISEAGRRAALERIPFICECHDVACTRLVPLTLAEYEQVRTASRRFLSAPGHEEHDPHNRVVSDGGRYTVVEKCGRAGEIAESLDQRQADPDTEVR